MFHDFGDFGARFQDFIPPEFANEVARKARESLINEGSPLVKCDTIGTYNTLILEFDAEVLLLIDFETDTDDTVLYEDDLAELVKLIDDDGLLLDVAGLESTENLIHELPVLLVIPGVVLPDEHLVHFIIEFVRIVLCHPKEQSEGPDEVLEQEPIQ